MSPQQPIAMDLSAWIISASMEYTMPGLPTGQVRLQAFTWRIRLGRSMVPRGFMGIVHTRGPFASLNLQKHSQKEMQSAMEDTRMQKYLSSLEQACATSVYAAVSSELEGKGDLYLEGASVAVLSCPPDGDAIEYDYASWAFDQRKEELWKLSKSLVGAE